jgi:DNA-binding winged helix-turn-helix (wHTH) protein/tetratricopeptide (TPR) repeat protein
MENSGRYRFGQFLLDIPERRLYGGSEPVALEPKTLDVLIALVRRAGQLASKRELLDEVWPDSFVEEGGIAVHIAALRRALGARNPGREFIETVPRYGYRFTGDVTPLQKWTLAVLPAVPFTNEILNGRDRPTGLAITDHLIDRIGRLAEFIIRPTRAVRAYMNTADDPAAIGRSLRADFVIDSHFFRDIDRVKGSAHLIRSEDGTRLWSGEFDEPGTDLMAIADSIAESVTAFFGVNTTRRAVSWSATRPEVYELFGRGRSYLLTASMFQLPNAVESFRSAIELDPTYAAAHAGLALACCAQAALRLRPPAEAYDEARSAALRALAMDDSSADAQVALGAVLYFGEWNWAGAERSLKRALSNNPNHTEAYLIYGQLLETLGRMDDGLRMKLRALERDPLSALVHLQISLSYWHQRRYEESIVWANKALELEPDHPHAREHLAGAYWKKGDFRRQIEENIKHAELHGEPIEALQHLKRVFDEGGRAAIVRLVLNRASHHPESFPAVQLAIFYGEAGDLDNALLHLHRALESRDPALVHLAVAPQWDALRVDPRFHECLARMGLKAFACGAGHSL